MQKKTIRDIDVNGKRVLLRVDYNVPMENGRITDDTRIRAPLPTINYLLKEKARVVLCTHLGRPGGKIVDELRLTPIAERLAGLITKTGVIYIQESSGEHAAATISALQPGGLALLENIRFYIEEEQNDILRNLDSISARVIRVLPDGNMIIKGQKIDYRQRNQVRYITTVTGVLRPADVNDSNIVSASKLANPNVKIKRQESGRLVRERLADLGDEVQRVQFMLMYLFIHLNELKFL